MTISRTDRAPDARRLATTAISRICLEYSYCDPIWGTNNERLSIKIAADKHSALVNMIPDATNRGFVDARFNVSFDKVAMVTFDTPASR